MKRLALARIRVCDRCGRGTAEFRTAAGDTVAVTLDPVRARQLRTPESDDGRTLTDVALEAIRAGGATVSEVVIDVSEGRLGALVSFLRGGDADVVPCTAEEAVALAVRGAVPTYATDEALAHASARPPKPPRHGGAGGPETVH